MRTRRLGATDLDITPIGFGAWAIGGDGWSYSWGPQDDAHSIHSIHRALEAGINWIDTAAVYGLGHSEEVVARALKSWTSAQRPLVFTKCGLLWNDAGKIHHDLTPASLRREVEGSLRRLGVERIDLYQIHWPDWDGVATPTDVLVRAWETLAALKDEGKVRHLGVSNFGVEHMRPLQAIAPIGSLQPPYSLVRRGIEKELLPWCHQQGVGVIVYSPLQSGLLSGRMSRERIQALAPSDWRRGAVDFQEPALSRNLQFVEQLRPIASRHGHSVAEVAIAWTLRDPAVTGAIVGARTPQQIDGVVGASELHLTERDLQDIERAIVETRPYSPEGPVAQSAA
ncbi:aldo/keto reductase [Vitiosangium sp. GDMCC 1.1324]|uniref:aldo/keto reductase n=1 Tax=Vitiosangium sp. (strain GDMCC 1.1324) TaxID=2138576 RepID=UPI000D36BEC3|nr:aldo/keto reductase [Vitiosangium sp. GDMCC 1.1324]PTL80391.1 aldo/keto reductase [Vitiosangium sp. GDMCC 1.1324]